MPLIKPIWRNREQAPKHETGSGQVLLKMYKCFPNLEKESGGCITMVLMDTGYILTKRTKLGVARGIPSKFRNKEWKIDSYTEENPEQVRYAWRAKGWILPKNFWVGPPELKPAVLKKVKVETEKLDVDVITLLKANKIN